MRAEAALSYCRIGSSILVRCGALSLAAWACTAAAQERPVLEEVLVTAQKRQESMQDAPIAITTVTGQDIRTRGMADISELAKATPNLIFDTTAATTGASSSVIFIRGVGQLDFALTTDPGVGVYVDGVYLSRSIGGVLDVVDIEQMEVLRGPQGTLFGRNTIGGAIDIRSRRPGEEFAGEASIYLGNFDRQHGKVAVDLPLGDRVKSRAVLMSKKQDGFVDGQIDDRMLGEIDRQALRLSAEIDLSDRFRILLDADYTRINEESAASVLIDTLELPPGSNCNPALNPNANAACVPGGPTMPFIWNNVDVPISGGALPPFDERWVQSVASDETFGTGPNGVDIDTGGAALTAILDLGTATVKLIAAHRESDGSFERDGDSSPAVILHTRNPEYEHEQTSLELQLVGSLLDDRLDYAAGVYYFDESGQDRVFVILPPSFAFVDNLSIVDGESIAGYAQGSYRLTEKLSLTAGLRYTEDKKKVDLEQFFVVSGPVGSDTFGGAPIGSQLPLVPPGESEETFDDLSMKLGVDYRVSDGLMAYASITEGFKSGGFNFRYLLPRADVLEYDPETVTSYELGFKWENQQRSLRVNAAAFHATYDDIQTIIYEFGAPLTQNAGEADIQGFEAEIDAVFGGGIRLSAGVGYTDASYSEVPTFDPNLFEAIQITKDKELPKTPEWSLNASVLKTFKLHDIGELTARVDWSYMSELYNDAQNAPQLFQGDRNLVDSSLTWDSPGHNIGIQLGVKNLTDERFILGGDANFGLGHFEANINRPREWYVGLMARF